MDDPNDLREAPKTWRAYLHEAKEAFGVLQWAWREFKTPEIMTWSRRLIAITLLMITFGAVQPMFLAKVFDGATRRNFDVVVAGLFGYAFFLMLQKLADNRMATVREWLLGLNMGSLDNRVTERFFEKSMGQHVQENFRLNPESIMTGRERLLNVQGLLLFEAIPVVIWLVFSYLLLFSISLVAGLIITLGLAVYFLWTLYLNQQVIEVCAPLEIKWRHLKRYRFERFKSVERVKTSAKEIEELSHMAERFDETILPDRNFWLWFINQSTMRGLTQVVSLLLIMSYGVHLVWRGEWHIGMLYPLFSWSAQVVDNVWRIGHFERQINWSMPSIRHMMEALSIPPAITSKSTSIELSSENPVEISFEGITHTYPAEGEGGTVCSTPVLKNVSFSIGAGERVALIGPSGAGKTTLMKLLLRFMDPEVGAIRVNGHDLRDVNLSSWMRIAAYIPQHAQILEGTIRYNLLYSLSGEERERWTDDRLWVLMRQLRIDFGERLNRGLETMVGERGLRLSGGQAQRVMIGAAAIQNPPFMIIDEATSHLDSSTEREVHDGLAQILSDKVGALIIAHRLSTVRDLCHRFVVLRDAEEVRNGDSQIEASASSFEELYAVSPTFKRLADDQHLVI